MLNRTFSAFFRDDASVSHVVSVTGYVASQANTDDIGAVLCLTSFDILRVEQTRTLSHQRRLNFHQRMRGGIAGTFLFHRAPLFSNAQLAGCNAFCSGVSFDTCKTTNDFLSLHSAMKTVYESSTSESTEHSARNYMSVVRQFASAQLDRQKASLTTNAGHEAADRAALVTNLHRTALEAALAHADTKQDLTIDTLKQWHSLLCRGGLVPEAGRLRTRNVRAGPTDFCPPEQVPLELDKLCKGIGALGSRLVGSNSPATLAAAVCFGVHPHYGADPNERPSGLWYLPILSKRRFVCAHQIPRRGIEEHLYHDGPSSSRPHR